MLPLTEGGDGRHDLAGSRTAVALGARDRGRPERLARMRTTQVAARARILLPCDSGETPGGSGARPTACARARRGTSRAASSALCQIT